MAIIGIFQTTEHGYTGTIETLALKTKVDIEAVEHKSSDKAPDYRVYLKQTSCEVGAAWEKGNSADGHYISVRLDDPSFVTPINCKLIKTGVEHSHSLIWERPKTHA